MNRFAALFLLLVCSAANAAPVQADGPSLSEVESCGRTFLEIEGQKAGAISWRGYGNEFDRLWTVPAYSNGTKVKAACYQCTEAVHRFVRFMYGVPSYYCGRPVMGNARYVARNLDRLLGDQVRSTARIAPYKVRMENYFNGSTACRPVTGAIVSLEIDFSEPPCNAENGTGGKCEAYTSSKAYDPSKGAGHVAIVRHMELKADGSLEGELFAQHGRMYSAREANRGAPIAPGRIRFKEDDDGNWFGWWWTPKVDGSYRTPPMPVVSWTNPVVVSRDAAEADFSEYPTGTACTGVEPTSSWAQGCEQIRASRP